MSKKSVTVHAGARDNYELSLALSEAGVLEKLVTEFYCPDGLIKIFPSLAQKRYKIGLSSDNTLISIAALWAELKMIAGKSFNYNNQKDNALSKAAYRLAKRKKAHLFCYSYYAGFAFSQQTAFEGQLRLLFQLHPHPASVRTLLGQELSSHPDTAASLMYENEMQYSEKYFQDLIREPALADFIFAASSYTKKTLVENGIPAENIAVVPYGVNGDEFACRRVAPKNKGLRIIFVGSIIQRKGLFYLLEAVARLNHDDIELVLCGRGYVDYQLLDNYPNINLTLKIGLSRTELVVQMHNSDLFVLPTLSEGFAHVILEAMSAGLPVLTTTNSCGPDVITEGKEGWVIPIRDTTAIEERLRFALDNKQNLFQMGQFAASTAAKYTWENFRESIKMIYNKKIHEARA